MLTNEQWSRIIRAVRRETGPGFQISKKEMEIILREHNGEEKVRVSLIPLPIP